jgi:DNA-binding transcriptional LysR family regulator
VLVARLPDAASAEGLRFEPLGDERHAVIAGGQGPRPGKRDPQLADLVQRPWILPPPGSVLHERLMGLFVQRGLPVPPNVIQTQSLAVITSLLRATDAVAVLQPEAVRPLCESGFLAILIEDIGLEVGCFGIITRKGYKLSPGAHALLECLRAAAAETG